MFTVFLLLVFDYLTSITNKIIKKSYILYHQVIALTLFLQFYFLPEIKFCVLFFLFRWNEKNYISIQKFNLYAIISTAKICMCIFVILFFLQISANEKHPFLHFIFYLFYYAFFPLCCSTVELNVWLEGNLVCFQLNACTFFVVILKNVYLKLFSIRLY